MPSPLAPAFDGRGAPWSVAGVLLPAGARDFVLVVAAEAGFSASEVWDCDDEGGLDDLDAFDDHGDSMADGGFGVLDSASGFGFARLRGPMAQIERRRALLSKIPPVLLIRVSGAPSAVVALPFGCLVGLRGAGLTGQVRSQSLESERLPRHFGTSFTKQG